MIRDFMRSRFGKGRGGGGQGAERGQGRGRGGGNRPASGPGGFCVCPKCGNKEPHVARQRCIDQVCSKCGAKMIKE
jgi:hypothetical protein